MSRTPIEWVLDDRGELGYTVNPIRAKDIKTGAVGHFCERVSPGCANCYASALQWRFKMHAFEPKNRKRVRFFLERKTLAEVLGRRAPTAYFWEDMSDIFGKWVPDAWLDAIFATIALTPKDIHMILTKRSDRMRHYNVDMMGLSTRARTERLYDALPKAIRPVKMASVEWPLPRLRLGVSIENQTTANQRLPDLLATPAWETFVSYEPALGACTLEYAFCSCPDRDVAFRSQAHIKSCALRVFAEPERRREFSFPRRIIIGGESGRGARPNYLQWTKSLLRQCEKFGFAAFVKQLGSYPTSDRFDADATQKPFRIKLLSSKGGDPLEWPPEYRVRQWPPHVVAGTGS